MKHGHGGYTNHKCRCEICFTPAREYQRAYQAKYRVLKREKMLAYSREYRARNLEIVVAKEVSSEGRRKRRERAQTRRARKLDQFLENVDPLVVYQMHGGCCGICKQFVAEDNFHVDHVIPLCCGGLHGYINVQPAHPRCNMTKKRARPV